MDRQGTFLRPWRFALVQNFTNPTPDPGGATYFFCAFVRQVLNRFRRDFHCRITHLCGSATRYISSRYLVRSGYKNNWEKVVSAQLHINKTNTFCSNLLSNYACHPPDPFLRFLLAFGVLLVVCCCISTSAWDLEESGRVTTHPSSWARSCH